MSSGNILESHEERIERSTPFVSMSRFHMSNLTKRELKVLVVHEAATVTRSVESHEERIESFFRGVIGDVEHSHRISRREN